MIFLDCEIINVIAFRSCDLTIQQDKKYLTFFCRKDIIRFSPSEIVRFRGSFRPSLFAKIRPLKNEQIIKHAFLRKSDHTGCNYVFALMFANMLYVSYQYRTNILISLNILLSDLNCTRVAVYFRCNCWADLYLVS